MQTGKSHYHKQHGIVYLWVIFLIFLLTLGLGKTLDIYSFQLMRENAAEKTRLSETCLEAIQKYYDSSEGYDKKYPQQESDLLMDPRQITLIRYLRKPSCGKYFISGRHQKIPEER